MIRLGLSVILRSLRKNIDFVFNQLNVQVRFRALTVFAVRGIAREEPCLMGIRLEFISIVQR